MLTLAHLSDVHLAPLPAAERWTDYLGKRALGYLSWRRRRRHIHGREVADAVAADIIAHRPDHVALTGDLINLSLKAEFAQAAEWLRGFGKPDWITFVPGNHDAYVAADWESCAGLWADYMTGDMRMPGERQPGGFAMPFPFVRQRRNVALIGLSTARPQSLLRAGGTLGTPQIEALATILRRLGERGYFRIVLIHHPPLPGQATPRKGLTDAAALRDVLVAEGAELVLHGHWHLLMQTALATRIGQAHVIGAPAASSRPYTLHAAGGWVFYDIKRQEGVWRTEATVRIWDAATGAMKTAASFTLS